MRRSSSTRAVLAALCLLSPLLAGCVPLGYAYPSVEHVWEVPVGPAASEVRAFRVDVADEQNCIEFPENDRCLLGAIPLTRKGGVPAQTQVAFDHGWLWHCIALSYGGHTSHVLMVRLYRPGYQTVEVKSWQKTGTVTWKVARDLAEQEQAVDDLLTTSEYAPSFRIALEGPPGKAEGKPARDGGTFWALAPGSAARRHREALLFAIGEYERLAAQCPPGAAGQEARERLAVKAKALGELAAK
jgi:hypothetical protein